MQMLFNFNIDGTTDGDGSTVGKCPSSRKCLSDGYCNTCKIISLAHQGCDITSSTPVCDADSTTSGIQDSAVGKLAACVACKMTGKCIECL